MHVQICGQIAIDDAGERLEGSLPSRQGRLLFAYLVVHRAQPTPRAELLDALWPDGGPADTDGALNALLSRLRRALGTDRVQGKSAVRLALADATIDLEAAEEAIHRAESAVVQQQWERAWAAAQVSLFTARRGFLPGEDAPWIDEVRRHLEQLPCARSKRTRPQASGWVAPSSPRPATRAAPWSRLRRCGRADTAC